LVAVFSRVGSTLTAVLWLAGALLATVSAGRAAGVVDPQYRALYDQAFRATYEHPDDVAAALNFAKVARLAGDPEGAVGALERVLIFNPDLPTVDLELGLLYRDLGSPEAARVHLLRADPARLSPEDRAQRETTLAALDRELTRHNLSGFATFGLRYQTNANAGASAAAQLAGGSARTLASLSAKADGDAFGAITVNHSYDLGDQSGDTWETRTALYGTRQFHRHLLNVGFAEIDTGPRFRLGDASDPTVRPYGVGNVFELGGTTYFVSGGGGINVHDVLNPRWSLDGVVEMRSLSYYASSQQPTAPDFDARQSLGRLTVGYAPTNVDFLSAAFQALDYSAHRDFQTYQEARLAASYTRRFEIAGLPQPWWFTIYGGPLERSYHHADPNVDPMHRRQDGEWDLGGALIVGLTDRIDFRLDVQQVWANSNVALYEYRDTSVLGSIGYRF
jgi:hypothetical protein